MWSATTPLLNALTLAAVGAIIILCAQVGRVLGATMQGRRALRLAPVVLVLLVAVYVSAAWIASSPASQEGCLYAVDHPSHKSC